MGKKDKKSKVTESDRASVAASSFNAAAVLLGSQQNLDEVPELIMALTDELFNVRLDWMTENKIGGAPKSTGGGGGNYKPSAGSKGSSGQSKSDNPTPKMVGFYGDLVSAIEGEGGSIKPSVKKFKELSFEDGSAAIDDAIERRDNLK